MYVFLGLSLNIIHQFEVALHILISLFLMQRYDLVSEKPNFIYTFPNGSVFDDSQR